MNAQLPDLLNFISGRIARKGNTQVIARFRNGRQQIYLLTPSSMPRSSTQRSNSDTFRNAVATTNAIYHDPILKAAWQHLFALNPCNHTSLYNFILSKTLSAIRLN